MGDSRNAIIKSQSANCYRKSWCLNRFLQKAVRSHGSHRFGSSYYNPPDFLGIVKLAGCGCFIPLDKLGECCQSQRMIEANRINKLQ